MKALAFLRRSLLARLLASYLAVAAVTLAAMATVAQLSAPGALDRHMTNTADLHGYDVAMGGMMSDLRANVMATVNEALLIGGVVSASVTLVVSVIIARRIALPVRAVTVASRGIAAGSYGHRVPETSGDEIGELALSFNQMARQLEQTEQRRVELIGTVAHELRTPLSTLQLQAQGMLDGVLPWDANALLEMQRELARLQRLVMDLEELSRAEAGQVTLDLRTVNIADPIIAAAKRLQLQYDGKSVTLRVDAPPDLPTVRIDAHRITQVLVNLLGNALHYTPSGGQVTVRARADRHELRVEVRDTGIGISPEHLPHVFERFYRVDKSRSRAGGGSGIGLTISRHLVDAHGGRIGAFSMGDGQGSTFEFALPLSASSRPWAGAGPAQ
ncbi:MAG: HAMP domain-containing histidine kinase [Thermoflexales bacterium]|nr:HAMP domain-containing histidine kinase [Thermoflexales bacterium]